MTQFQQRYQVSDTDVIAELRWYGKEELDGRLDLILAARPTATLGEICDEFVRSVMPAGAAQMARRAFQAVARWIGKSGSSFIRRFQTALTEYRRFDTPNEQRLYDDFLSQLNPKYFGELRTDISDNGSLGLVLNLASRLFGGLRRRPSDRGDQIQD